MIAVLVAAAAQAGQGQQTQPPIFRAQVDAVEIDAFVTDAQGNPAVDLTADDFEVFEEGVRQTITSFSLVDIPIERAERPLYSPTAIEPDVFTNQGGEGRVYVFALDEVRADLALRTRLFLRRFVERHFGANDVAALVYLGRGRRGDTQDFTSNRRLLLAAIERYGGGFPSDQLPGAVGGGDRFDVDRRMRALRDLAEFMATMRGRRKVMVYVTQELGDVYGVLDYNGGARSIAFDDLHAAVTAATRGNVSIYPVNPAGLDPGGGTGDSETSARATTGACGLDCTVDMRALADATGGFAVINTNRFDAELERIVRENSTYYVLGFTSTNDRRDGRFRELTVRVKRPGLVVRSRRGYLAPMRNAPAPAPAPSALPTPVAESLRSALANPAVPMRVFAAPFRGADGQADVAVAIDIDAAALGLVERNGVFEGELAVATMAIDARGDRVPGQRHEARLALKPESYQRATAQHLRVLSGLRLRPGRYQLRVAGGTPQRAGSVIADLDVPDFSREPLMMSGVALTSTETRDAFVLPGSAPLREALPGPITTSRSFRSGDTITLFTEIYENQRRAAAHTVDITLELRTDDGRVVRTSSEQRSSRELGGRSGGYGFTADVPLNELPAGIYVIHVEARANTTGLPTVARDVQITVR